MHSNLIAHILVVYPPCLIPTSEEIMHLACLTGCWKPLNNNSSILANSYSQLFIFRSADEQKWPYISTESVSLDRRHWLNQEPKIQQNPPPPTWVGHFSSLRASSNIIYPCASTQTPIPQPWEADAGHWTLVGTALAHAMVLHDIYILFRQVKWW